MASAVAGVPVEVTASAVPHAGLPLYLSIVTIALGVAAYLAQDRLREGMAGLLAAIGWGPDRGFDQVDARADPVSFAVTRIVQNGRLDIYLTVTFIAVAADPARPDDRVRRTAGMARIPVAAAARMDDRHHRRDRPRRGRLCAATG